MLRTILRFVPLIALAACASVQKESAPTAGLSGAVPAQKADPPSVKVGDRWTFEARSIPNGAKSTRTVVITSVGPSEIRGTENGRPLTLSIEMNGIDSPRGKHSDQRFLSFPLEVGKKWSFTDDYVVNDTDSGTLQGHSQVSVQVAGYERVRVAAGEFDAFKLEANGDWKSPQAPPPGTGQSHTTYWYAPAARIVVKSESQVTYMGTTITELVELQLQP
ncbi:exported hypothetical protein [Burkholderiales bacterium]|jgi:hypothetical protein|nr:exported hypothetical protein [Burkholderiales bacterium]